MRRPSAVTIAVLAIVLAVVLNFATSTVRVPAWAVPWIWVLAAAVSVAVVVNEVRVGRVDQLAVVIDLDEEADRLAVAIRGQWTREEEFRQINDPLALPVTWHAADEQYFDHWANIRRAPVGDDPGPLVLDGDVTTIADTYQRIPSGRLVILGEAGTGKSVLVTRLVLDLLDSRQDSGRVPVLVTIGSWDPSRTDWRQWLAEQTVRDHPSFARRGPAGLTVARALVDGDLILPVLDGSTSWPSDCTVRRCGSSRRRGWAAGRHQPTGRIRRCGLRHRRPHGRGGDRTRQAHRDRPGPLPATHDAPHRR